MSTIKSEIDNLHRRGSGDWQTLHRQAAKTRANISYNLPQLLACVMSPGGLTEAQLKKHPNLIQPKSLTLEWGRGTGKSTYIARRMANVAGTMPRSNNILLCETYKSALDLTLPSTIYSLEMHGYYEGLHYFIGRKPPTSWDWPTPYQPPKTYDRSITWWTGAHYRLISHDLPSDGVGMNIDSQIGDEAAKLDPMKMEQNTNPTFRGSNKKAFEKEPLWLSSLWASSTPTTLRGRWLLENETKSRLYPGDYGFIKANALDNKDNLPDGWLEERKKASLYEWLFNAEYLNIRPQRGRGAFYTLLSEEAHGYNAYNYNFYNRTGIGASCLGDTDIDPTAPIILGVDWGAAINSAVALQATPRHIKALKDFYVLGDLKQIQDDLFNNIADYYAPHPNKTIHLYYDNTGNLQTGNTRATRAKQAQDLLAKKGWTVHLLTRGNTNPLHERKHMLWNSILAQQGHNFLFPTFSINLSNCRTLLISMQNARAIEGRNQEIKKDKSDESNKSIERQYATDLSDAIDAPIYGLYGNLLYNLPTTLPS